MEKQEVGLIIGWKMESIIEEYCIKALALDIIELVFLKEESGQCLIYIIVLIVIRFMKIESKIYMNIIYKNKEASFEEIECGEVFSSFGTLYMRINEMKNIDGTLLNAVFLDQGDLTLFTDNEKVVRVNGAFIVE